MQTIILSLLTKISSEEPVYIILADDDKDDREIFVEAVKQVAPEMKVVEVGDGRELLQLLKTTDTLPGIIFLDLNMPLPNGHECLLIMRNNPKLENIPIVIYSTSSYEADIDLAYANGANHFLIKPNDLKSLQTILQWLLSKEWEENSTPQRKEFVLSAKALMDSRR